MTNYQTNEKTEICIYLLVSLLGNVVRELVNIFVCFINWWLR
jgi:hypothetical protein